ncbi:MAG TPA: electron transfer flavoprotein-ubiquinone oxidoreductase [Blastocatellia bacterium]|nr:electron transfer flavoprotein-ubiquinone oxidoreductase [Blastocatellia bacterium]
MENIERESLDVDVLFVGAGPASLAGAYRLRQLINRHNESAGKTGAKQLGEISIAVIEKGREIGSHIISGAVMDPRAIKELIPDFRERGCPLESEVTEEDVSYFTATRKFKSPIIPPPLNNHGNYVVSLNKVIRWLGPIVEEAGVDIFPEFPGAELLLDGSHVVGVRTGDKGIGRDGEPKDNFEPGVDIHARVTVFGEGSRGSLVKKLVERLKLDEGRNPQVYACGVKEVWELPKGRVKPGWVMHTLGYPLPGDTFGGSFVYGMQNDLLDLGLVVGLDYRNPHTDPHRLFQQFKLHPFIANMLEGGKMLYYGAKTIPEGGYFSQPKYYGDGFLIIGDAASFLQSQKLKGIHMAIQSGMFAAQAIYEALVADRYDDAQLERFEQLIRSSWVEKELYEVRNFHQSFEHGRIRGLVESGIQFALGGRSLRGDLRVTRAGHQFMRTLAEAGITATNGAKYADPEPMRYDNKLTFDKVTDVYRSGTEHTEDQPPHLKILDLNICISRCTREYGNPCQHFCPAAVYEVEEKDGGRAPKLNFSNCVHCKTCDIMDPYQIIDWVTPEGGGGPNYINL